MPVNFGKETLDLFLLDPKWKNLNNGDPPPHPSSSANLHPIGY
jgi:hypothetical protein